MKKICRTIALPTIAMASSPVLAQTGSLLYSPNINSIPVAAPLVYVVLAFALVGCAYFVLRRRGSSGSTLTGIGVVFAISLFALGQLGAVRDARAALGFIQSHLSNPAGGSVVVHTGEQNFLNNSGVTLRISGLVTPCGSSNDATQKCSVGEIVANGDSCNTDFTCP